MQKGVTKETIDCALRDILPEEGEVELAMNALRKYSPKLRDEDDSKRKAKCYRHLMARGFSNETAYEVTRMYLEEIK